MLKLDCEKEQTAGKILLVPHHIHLMNKSIAEISGQKENCTVTLLTTVAVIKMPQDLEAESVTGD